MKNNILKLIVNLVVPIIILTMVLLIVKSIVTPKQEKIMSLLQNPTNPVVKMNTSEGDIFIELFQDTAPITVENFLKYVKSNLYNQTIFHRVIYGFVIQGGGFDAEFNKLKTFKPIQNEAHNGIKNLAGTIAMARTNLPNSATNQFFINLSDNFSLDFQNTVNYGYSVFGRVIDGDAVIDKIARSPVATKFNYKNVPVNDIVINYLMLIEN